MEDLEARALARLEPAAAEYITRGAGGNDTRQANLDGWRRLQVRPHVLRDVSAVDTSTTVLGIPVAAPILVAPTAQQHLVCPDAECATARAAAATGTVMVSSMASSRPFAEIAAAAPDGPQFAQMYMLRDRGRSRAIAEAARDAGARAIVASVDAGAIPYGRGATELGARVAGLVAEYDASVTIDDVMRLGEWSGLPVVVKGVVRSDDARECVDAGVAAVYVSNHGVASSTDASTPLQRSPMLSRASKAARRSTSTVASVRVSMCCGRSLSAPRQCSSAAPSCGASRWAARQARARCSNDYTTSWRARWPSAARRRSQTSRPTWWRCGDRPGWTISRRRSSIARGGPRASDVRARRCGCDPSARPPA